MLSMIPGGLLVTLLLLSARQRCIFTDDKNTELCGADHSVEEDRPPIILPSAGRRLGHTPCHSCADRILVVGGGDDAVGDGDDNERL